jgi:uncharacterized protein (DUF362 family)
VNSEDKEVTRRDFLRRLGVGAVGLTILGACRAPAGAKGTQLAALPQAPPPTPTAEKVPVAVIRHRAMLADPTTPRREAVLAALDAGLCHVFGEKDPAQAWRKVCTPTDVVAIKVNCISGLIYSHPVLAQAIAQRLTDIGVPAENIIIWDRTSGELARSGYQINRDGPGVRCYGTDGAYDDWLAHRSIRTRLSKIITQAASVIINVPVLKHHGSSGVTLAMKNHYGSIANPGDLHANNCDPGIPELNDIPAIREKTRLIVVDAVRGLFDGGPGGRPDQVWPAQTLIISANPVAADALGLEIIDAARRQRGLPSLASQAHHIATAAQLGLGPNQRAGMNVLELELG